MTLVILVAHLAAMRAAFDRGDLDETARQGALAGPAAIERVLATPGDRAGVLAAIVAAPAVVDAPELLPALGALAGGPDRRTAIPAARAAVAIARALHRAPADDDLAASDVDDWRQAWGALALNRDRFIEVRVAALEVAADLAAGGDIGYDLVAALAEPDAAVRVAAASLVPVELPPVARTALATAAASDADDGVALAAAAALCVDGVGLAPATKPRIAKLVAGSPRHPAARCAR